MLNRLRRRVAARRSRAVVRARAKVSGVDVEALLALARQSFVKLQAAWDAADVPALQACTTPPLWADLREQLRTRGDASNHTEVVALRAELLAIEEIREAYVASVEFSGLIREHHNRPEAPFRELWLLAHAKNAGPGWRIAGVQSLS